VVSIDSKRVTRTLRKSFVHGGRKPTGLEAVQWAAERWAWRGRDRDQNRSGRGRTKAGYDLEDSRGG